MGVVSTLPARVWKRLRRLTWLDEEHVWHELDVRAEGAPFGDGDELVLVRPDAEQLRRIDDIPSMGAQNAARLEARGGEPWMVFEDDHLLFACWIYRRRSPMIAARRGWLELPAGAVALEDSVAAGRARGRGVAPRTWRALADRLADEGHRAMITKVEVANTPSRRAVAKAGFREIAVMRLRRRGPRTRVSVEVLDAGSLAPALRDVLER